METNLIEDMKRMTEEMRNINARLKKIHIPTIQDYWYSVKNDGLPNVKGKVKEYPFILTVAGKSEPGFYSKDRGFMNENKISFADQSIITAYMYYPEPYIERIEEENSGL